MRWSKRIDGAGVHTGARASTRGNKMLTRWLEWKSGTKAMLDCCSGRGGAAVILGLLLAFPLSARAQQCYSLHDPVCDDTNPCTEDICFMGFPPYYCVHSSNCSDDQFCNGVEVCCTTSGGCGSVQWGQCVPGEDIPCPPGQYCSENLDDCVFCEFHSQCDDDNPCTEDTCDMSIGCQYDEITVSCSDDNLCTTSDACRDVCEGGDHDGELCVGDGDCFGAIPGECSGWACAGYPRDCNEEAPECYTGTCDPYTGDCNFSQQSDDTPCNDNNLCTPVDKCQDGVCVGGPVNGCVQMELRGPSGGTYSVGDVIDFELFAWSDGCPPSEVCGGSIQAVSGIEVALSWDPGILELADPQEIGEPNPEDPCDDPDSCNYDCGFPGQQYNWGSSLFPNDCDMGDGLNAPCEGIPGNDGNAKYLAFMHLQCDGSPALPACVQGFDSGGFKVTTFKFKAISPTKGVSGPTAVVMEDCISQTKTFVASGSTTGDNVTGDLGDPAEIEIACVEGSDCPLDICEDGVCMSCPPPTIVTEGPRYFGVTPQEGPLEVAIRITGVDPDVSCVSGYVQADGKLGTLGDPVYLPPGAGGWGTAHVRGADLMSGMTYAAQADCDPQHPGVSLSEPVSDKLWRWGDVDDNGVVEILDAVRILDGFRGMFHTIPCDIDQDCIDRPVPPYFTCDLDVHKCRWIYLENVDIYGSATCTPNRVIEIVDVTLCLDAFRGYADPCAVSCP